MTDTETIPVTFTGSFGTVKLDCPIISEKDGIVTFDTTPLAEYLGMPIEPATMRKGGSLMQRVRGMLDSLR